MNIFKDQMHREVSIQEHPQRIISLVPSQTELLFDLGLDDEIIGVTKFCMHPKEKCKQKTNIGGTKKFNFDLIESLEPDLIIGNKEENYKEGIEYLSQKHPVWMSDILDLKDACKMIESLGKITNKHTEYQDLIKKIRINFEGLKPNNQATFKKKVAYFIWRKPYMLAGGGTFINHMIELCGWENIFEHQARYPEISADELRYVSPDYIFLSSEPFPFRDKHIKEFEDLCPQSKVCIVDGEMFSWYGSRLQYSAAYFKTLMENLEGKR